MRETQKHTAIAQADRKEIKLRNQRSHGVVTPHAHVVQLTSCMFSVFSPQNVTFSTKGKRKQVSRLTHLTCKCCGVSFLWKAMFLPILTHLAFSS